MRLAQVTRLAALVRQAEKGVRKLASVQRRLTALLLAAGDRTLTEDTLATFERLLDDAARTLTTCQAEVLAAREAADNASGLAKECDD